jgi:hypothetical protein
MELVRVLSLGGAIFGVHRLASELVVVTLLALPVASCFLFVCVVVGVGYLLSPSLFVPFKGHPCTLLDPPRVVPKASFK